MIHSTILSSFKFIDTRFFHVRYAVEEKEEKN